MEDIRDLARRALLGEEDAQLEIVERYQSDVFGLCFRMLRQRQDAEDLAQETFLRAFRSLSQWDPERDFRPWLFAIAGNRCRTLLAQRRRQPQTAELIDQHPDQSMEFQAARQFAEEVQLAIADLRDEYQQAFVLFQEQALSYAEVSAALGCPIGTIKTRVHRARREIVARLRSRGIVGEIQHAAG